jgi:adenylate kinase family enzyme
MVLGKIPQAVVEIGRPGAGKDTCAEELVAKYGFYQISSSGILKRKLSDPDLQNDPIIIREKALFEKGDLMTPDFVLNVMKEGVMEQADLGNSIVLSGSPRTIFEAFGEDNNGNKMTMGLIQFLETLYVGRTYIIFIDTPMWICRERALKRKRADGLDDIKKLTIRHREYRQRTRPIVDRLKAEKRSAKRVNGVDTVDEVMLRILKHLGLSPGKEFVDFFEGSEDYD